MARAATGRELLLRKGVEIERVKREGRRRQTPYFNLVWCAGMSARARTGVIVGRRLGHAVDRNRAKRIFRELARLSRRRLVGGRDILIFPRRQALQVAHATLRDAWLSVLQEEGLVSPGGSSSQCASFSSA